MPTPPIANFNLKHACARQFAARPTLRQVASQRILTLLVEQLPWLASVQPALTDAAPFMLDSPDPETAYWTTAPLVDVVLHSLLSGTKLDLEPLGKRTHNLGLSSPYRFAGSQSEFDTRSLMGMSGPLNDLVTALPEYFCQAQIDYWNGAPYAAPDGYAVSRHCWMQQALRMALLGNVGQQRLTDAARTCVYEMLSGRFVSIQAQAIEVVMRSAQADRSVLLPDLLVALERDEDRLLLWSPPSGKVRAYADAQAFGEALRDFMAREHRFDSLTWNTYALQGDAFMQQSALLLGWLLTRLDHVRWSRLASVEQMEAVYWQLSDPSEVFFNESYFCDPGVELAVPDWLSGATSEDRFDYQAAVLDLAVDQALSGSASSRDGLLDLQAYARQRLREQLLADYPVEANYFSDDLLLTVREIHGVPGGVGVGPGDGVIVTRTMTLTELAIGNLSALGHSTITAIKHRTGQEIMSWLTPGYLKDLVEKVDIGAGYPTYVQATLDDAQKRDERISLFAREWRNRLLFDALSLRIEGGLSKEAWQALAEFCRSNRDLKANVDIAALAFSVPAFRARDTVSGMFVIRLAHPAAWLLYRPLYGQDSLRQFSDATALMAAIADEDALQSTVLTWMETDARAVYQNGGFKHPHLLGEALEGVLEVAVPGGSAVVEGTSEPARIKFTPWLADVDTHLFVAGKQVLVTLAKRDSVSTRESRWERLKEGAWLLFNVVAPVLKGPVAIVTWLALALESVEEDVAALKRGNGAEKSLAILDLVSNLSMMLLHGVVPKIEGAKDEPEALEPIEMLGGDAIGVAAAGPEPVEKGRVYLGGALQESESSVVEIVSGWGSGPVASSQALQPFVAKVDLHGVMEDSHGFYRVDGQRYVELYGERYQVRLDRDEVRIVGPGGREGPYLWRGLSWTVRKGLFGGMPKKSRTLAAKQKEFERLVELESQNTKANNVLKAETAAQGQRARTLEEQLNTHKAGLLSVQVNAEGKFSQEQIGKLSDFHQAQIAHKTSELLDLRKQMAIQREASSEYERNSLKTLEQISELQRHPGIERPVNSQFLEDSRQDGLKALAANSWNLFEELREAVAYEQIKSLMSALDGRRIHEVLVEYRALLGHLKNAVSLQERMIQASLDLDFSLSRLDPQTLLYAAQEPYTAAKVATLRKLTTERVRFHQASNYIDLALPMDKTKQLERQARYRKQLGSDGLRSAASSHGLLPLSNLPAAQRIEILQTAWDEYSTAIVNGLDIGREGGAGLERGMLDGYMRQLQALKDMASEQLSEAIAEQDSGQLSTRRQAYGRSAAPQHAVRTVDGELVIASEQKDGDVIRLKVDEPITGVRLHTFEKRGDAWEEVVAEVPEPSGEGAVASDARIQAEALLAEDQQVEVKARHYVASDVRDSELKRLLDEHDKALRGASAALARVGEDGAKAVMTRLSERIEYWTARRTALLTEHYLQTRYPGARALAFLHRQGLIKVTYEGPRQRIANGTAMDEYSIKHLRYPGDVQGVPLWAAHFHFSDQAAPPHEFTRAHLKTWQQRFYGRVEALELARQGERIHRGPLTYEQVKGIIPFA